MRKELILVSSNPKAKRGLSRKTHGMANGYRSGLEERIAKELSLLDPEYEYESFKLSFIQPVKKRTYTPDFLLSNGIIVETKGRFMVADRQKHLWIQEQHPDLDIRFVFQNPLAKISKTSKTTYADWCEKYGFKYAAKSIPKEWVKERPRGNLPRRGKG